MKLYYRRMISTGMISLTSFLAFIYTLVCFSKEPVIVGVVALTFVASLYILLNVILDLAAVKEQKNREFITETVTNMVSSMASDSNEELERISKATYVQLRKIQVAITNHEDPITTDDLSDMVEDLSDSIENSAKIISKYNIALAKKTATKVGGIENTVKELSTVVDSINSLIVLINDKLADVENKIENIDLSAIPVQVVSATAENPTPAITTDATENVSPEVETDIIADTTPIEETKEEVPVDDDPNRMLSPDDIAALFAAATPAEESAEEKAEEVVEEKIEETPVDDDPNRMLSPDDIAALFAAATPAEESAEDKVEEVVEEKIEEAPVDDDPNRMLSPDDIAALFAAATPAEETTEEIIEETESIPTVGDMLELSEDPNKQMSEDEIAALFAASKEQYRANSMDDFKVEDHPEPIDSSLIDALLGNDDISFDDLHEVGEEASALVEDETNEEASVTEAPIDDDPNRMLSPDDIAALFAAAAPAEESAKDKTEEVADENLADVIPFPTKTEDTEIAEEPTPVNEDPNKMLSPEEIAALFASAAPVEEKVEEPAPEPAPVSEDPNKMLSPEEIAALFASAGN